MRLLKVIKEPFGSIKRELLEMDLVDLVLRLTLIDLLFRPVGDWMVRPFVLILAALGLISPKVLRSSWTWLVLAFLTGLRVVRDWPMSDNNVYFTGGETSVDGQLSSDFQKNWRAGATVSVPLGRQHALKALLHTGVATRTGSDFDIFTIAYQYTWF